MYHATCPHGTHLSPYCDGYDFTWHDKQGQFHVAYPSAKIHDRCTGSERAWDMQGRTIDGLPCECPCHYLWQPEFRTAHYTDHRVKIAESDDTKPDQ